MRDVVWSKQSSVEPIALSVPPPASNRSGKAFRLHFPLLVRQEFLMEMYYSPFED
jgi:hypothetical protein